MRARKIFVVAIILYIRGQKTLPFRARMKNGRSVFRSKRPRALARGASFLCLNLIGCVAPIQKPIAYRVEVYFSPVGHVRDHITDAIDNSRTSIDIAIFDFTSQEIKASLEKVKEKGGKIRIIADSKQYKGSHSVIQSLIDSGFDVKITHGKGRGIMHNKFAILDNILLFAGSYNWTDNAKHFNYENAVFISEAEVIKQYQKEFDKIWSST